MSMIDLPEKVRDSAIKMANGEDETLFGYYPNTAPNLDEPGRVYPVSWSVITDKGLYEITPDGYVVRAQMIHPWR